MNLSLFKRDVPEAGQPWQHFAVYITGWICLASVLFWILYRVWLALFIPWWCNRDEVVYYYEVIRQLRLDPSQTFFDIPGTPFMTLTSVLTFLWWAGERVAGSAGSINPSDFAFVHIQGVFTLMRVLTLGLYLAAAAITLDLFRRSAGTLTAIVAALLFASLPINVHYSYFVRTESLGLVLCLCAIWIVLYSRSASTPRAYCYAGVLAGAAMAARFHFALVGFPVILLIFFLRERGKLSCQPDPSGHRALYAIAGALSALFIAGGIVTVLFKAKLIGGSWLTDTMMLTLPAGHMGSPWFADRSYAAARGTVAKLWLLLGVVGITAVLARLPQTRKWLWPLLNPFTLSLGVGFTAGFLLSHPTFLWRGEYQLQSIQFYSGWNDPNLESVGPLRSWWNVTSFYFTNALPERWLLWSFLVGAGVILWRRETTHLAFLGGAAICFFAHPLTMKLWPHHIIPWLPFLCFVAATPVGLLGAWLVRRYNHPVAASTVVLLSSVVLLWACPARLRRAAEYLNISYERTEQIAEMNDWLSQNVPPDAYLLVSFFALNDDGYFRWIENAGVEIPEFVKRRRDVRIWLLKRAAVDGKAGFVCVSPADVAFFREDSERRNPDSTYNPFEDPSFQPMAQFGSGLYGLQVFKFDFHRGQP